MNKKILPTFLLLLLLHACTDLEENLYEVQTDATFFRSEDGYRAVMATVYNNLRALGNHGGFFSMQEISSDEIAIPERGNEWGDGGQWINAHRHEFKTYDPSINNAFNFLYTGINACNRAIYQFEALKRNNLGIDALSDKYIAEARALRALYYYWALDAFGNIPIVTEYAMQDVPQPFTTPRADVFKFVENELRACYQSLDKKNDAATYGRMNYYAAMALWAKLYLNAEVYSGTARLQDVVSCCDAIINSGLFTLEPNYRNLFRVQNEANREFILAVPFDEKFAKGFNLGQMTLHYGSQATYQLKQQPWNGYCTLQDFYEMHDNSDVRKQNFIAGPQYAFDGVTPIIDIQGFNDPDGPQVNYTPELNELSPQCYRQAGARIGKYEFKTGADADLDNDMPIFRYADILLMKAEALWRIDPGSAEALALVNQVRNRSYEPDQPLQQLTAQNLLDERGRELFYEGMRRQDLIRFGVYGNPTEFMPGSAPCKELWPIPVVQLTLSPNIQQNPCY
jgi:hypothetical protein